MEKSILWALFLLPGFLSYIIVCTFKLGFGKDSDTLEKTFYSLLFNVPIFIGTLLTLNESHVVEIIQNWNETYSGFETFKEFQVIFSDQINLMAVLAVVSLFVAVIVSILWMVILYLTEVINNAFRKHKITFYTNLWKNYLVREKEERPVTIYSLSDNTKLTEGFLQEVSTSLDKDIELKIGRQKLFQTCLEQGIIGDIEYEYININKNIKIAFYSMETINNLYKENKGVKQTWRTKIITTAFLRTKQVTNTMRSAKEPLKRIARKLICYSKSLRIKISKKIRKQ